MLDKYRMLIWQNFIKLLYPHFFEVDNINSFYFEMLENIIKNFDRDPKRVLIENNLNLLQFEGRLHLNFECFLREKKIYNRVNIVRGYLTACENCIPQKGFELEKIKSLFYNKKTTLLNDNEIEKLFNILKLGI